MIVTSAGAKAGDVADGDLIDAVLDPIQGEPPSHYTAARASVFGAPVTHACQRITSRLSGATCVVSNNGLVVVDDPQRGLALSNVQAVGSSRVAVVIDGVLMFEPCFVKPAGEPCQVAQLLIPGACMVAGEAVPSRARFLITGGR
ncbi:MAG TPA: hypothetical protein VII66_02780 [Gemmatimonadaceae bacterium]